MARLISSTSRVPKGLPPPSDESSPRAARSPSPSRRSSPAAERSGHPSHPAGQVFSADWPAETNASRHPDNVAAVTPNSRDSASRSSPDSNRTTATALRFIENQPRDTTDDPLSAPLALRARSADSPPPSLIFPTMTLLQEKPPSSPKRVSQKTLGWGIAVMTRRCFPVGNGPQRGDLGRSGRMTRCCLNIRCRSRKLVSYLHVLD